MNFVTNWTRRQTSPLQVDDAPGLPRRRGWAHRVVDRQDQCVSIAQDIALPLAVLTLPVNSCSAGLRFVAFAGDESITRSREAGDAGINSDTLRLYADIGYRGQLTFVAPTPSEPVRELSNV